MFKNIKKKWSSDGGQAKASTPKNSTAAARRTEGKVAKKSKTTYSIKKSYKKADLLRPVASFSDTPGSQRQALFIQKLRLCSVMFSWEEGGSQADAKSKEMKRLLLLELVEYIGKNKQMLQDSTVLSEIISMVCVNLFRALPPEQTEADDLDEEEPIMDPSWTHLQIVYELFLRILAMNEIEARLLKKYVNTRFILRVLQLFNCEDHRERDYLKTILHRIYARFMPLRSFVRKSINHVFFTFIYETEAHRGIAELLEILGSVINGFARPLKQEHKNFLRDVLIPMHRVPNLDIFHPQLGYCVVQFVDKDGLLAVPVIQGLLKFWPQTNSAKEVLLLTELEEILELTSDEQFASIIQPLFSQLALCIGSPHFQVSERMLFFWHNEYITGLVLNHREEVLPIIFSALQRNSQSHWNEQVATLSLGVLKLFIDTDSTLVDRVSKELEEKDISYANNHASNQDAWAALTTEVQFKTPVFEKGDYSYGKAELLKEQAVERKSR